MNVYVVKVASKFYPPSEHVSFDYGSFAAALTIYVTGKDYTDVETKMRHSGRYKDRGINEIVLLGPLDQLEIT